MKIQTKAIMAIAVVSVLALATVSGITYSWFSDSENSEITVSTGIVKVDTEVTDVGTAGTYITNLVSGKSVPKDMEIKNLVGNENDKLVIDFKYSVKFYNTISAKYYVDATSSDAGFVKIDMVSGSTDVKVGDIIDIDAGSTDTPTADAEIHVTITINLSNEYMGKEAKITIRNEIVQSNAEIYKIQKAVDTTDDLKEAMNSNDSAELKLSDGDYTLSGVSLKDKGDKKITGNGASTVVDNSSAGLLSAEGTKVALQNLTFKSADREYTGFNSKTLSFKDCTIEGQFCLYGDLVTFDNCTFNLGEGKYIWAYTSKKVVFNDCTFNTNGKAILIYNEGGIASQEIEVNNCVFKASKGATSSAISNMNCSAIEIDSRFCEFTLSTSGNTIDNDFSGEWRIKAFAKPVHVNGSDYDSTALDGKKLTIVNSTVTEVDSNPYTIAYNNCDVEVLLSQNIEDIVVDLKKDGLVFDIEPYSTKPMGGSETKTVTINGNGNTLYFNNTNSDWNNIIINDNATLILEDITIDNTGYNKDGGPWNSHDLYFNCNVKMTDVICNNAIALCKTSLLENVNISDKNATGDTYVVWICAGADVTINNSVIDGTSSTGHENRAIAIKDQYVEDATDTNTKLTITDTKLSSDKYAAILVTNAGKTAVTLNGTVDISETKDSAYAVWYDEGSIVDCNNCDSKKR